MNWVRIQPDDNAVNINPGDGGSVAILDRADAPGLEYSSAGVAPIPLVFEAPAEGRVHIETLDYVRQPTTPLSRLWDGLDLPLAAAALPLVGALGGDDAVADRREREMAGETRLTRRQLVIAGGTLLGGAALTPTEAAASDTATRAVAEADITVNDRGLTLRLRDEVASVLPRDRTYQVYQDGEQLATITSSEPSATIPPGRTGMTSVLTEADVGVLQDLRALFSDSDAVEYTADLPQPASDIERGEWVTVTGDDALVSPVQDAGAGSTVVTLGGQSIGHVDERTTDAGAYRIKNGRLQYRAGEAAPDAATVTVAAGVPAWTEARDDAARILG